MPELKDDLSALRIEREPERPRAGRWLVWVGPARRARGGRSAAARWAMRERPVEVEVAAVSERAAGTQAVVLNASGYVTARRRATVSSKITGKVVEVNVEEGMAVKEGQVLARLDDATFRASLSLAEAQAEAARRNVRESEVRLAEAKLSLGRVMQLVKDQLATASEVDKSQAEVDSLEARIAASREQVRVVERQIELEQTNLDNTIIRAPFSGVAISKDAQPGEMVSPVSAGGGFTRTGICTIVDMRSLEIEVDVNESYINRVEAGSERDGDPECVPGVGDSRARHHDGAGRGPAEGDGARPHRLQEARPAHSAGHGRQGDVPARHRRGRRPGSPKRDGAPSRPRNRSRSCPRPPSGSKAIRPTPSSCPAASSTAARSRRAASTAIGSKWWPGFARAIAWSCSPPPALASRRDGTEITVRAKHQTR